MDGFLDTSGQINALDELAPAVCSVFINDNIQLSYLRIFRDYSALAHTCITLQMVQNEKHGYRRCLWAVFLNFSNC